MAVVRDNPKALAELSVRKYFIVAVVFVIVFKLKTALYSRK
jgi:hypothetical protein